MHVFSKAAMESFVITIQPILQYQQTEVVFQLLYKKQLQKNALGSWILVILVFGCFLGVF